MQIEIWSDVVCPWCYIGKRRLEKALSEFPHADQVEVHWRSYLLDPSAPAVATETVAESLGKKYGGGPEAGRQMIDRVVAVAAEEGMAWQYDKSMRVSTIDAHRLLHLAHATGGNALQGAFKEALLEANFIGARNVGDKDVLRELAVGAGLPADRVEEVLASEEYFSDVQADIEQAQRYGASGVPFYVVDGKYGVSGAQSGEVFTQVLEKAWADTHPAIEVVGGGEECGPDGCAV
ncbi:MAG: DsbA family protein [Nocardioides sp.]|uniref:DsbA family oxidoreductase n=1 Tax=Nocardioides sp. TaxID=35761 RepID=UPI003F0EB4F4